ncbi:hypothetical protein CRG93_24830 [Escherichia sp. E2593]|uniref:hypothetical protein n=1 Tax=Escherichia sp. E2593 TaxID=2044458 RepID=UPI00107F472A|nr:hypothetical protein [Escherichia sp. E2593]TGC05420.1 hypothetical protein CRG93_24830 [Escherichia sp. E2593]
MEMKFFEVKEGYYININYIVSIYYDKTDVATVTLTTEEVVHLNAVDAIRLKMFFSKVFKHQIINIFWERKKTQ